MQTSRAPYPPGCSLLTHSLAFCLQFARSVQWRCPSFVCPSKMAEATQAKPHRAVGSHCPPPPAAPAPAAGQPQPSDPSLASITVLQLGQDELMAVARHVTPSNRHALRLACKAWRGATDAAIATPTTGAVPGMRAKTDLRSIPPPALLPTGIQSSVRRIKLSFNYPLRSPFQTPRFKRTLEAGDKAVLTAALANLQLGAVAPLHRTIAPGSTPASTPGSTLGSTPGRTPGSTPASTATPARTLTLSLANYKTTTQDIEDMLQQAGVLGAWPQVEVWPGGVLLDGHLSEHLVVADVVGLAPGYIPGCRQAQPGRGPAPSYPQLLDIDLTEMGDSDVDGLVQLLNARVLPQLRRLKLGASRMELQLPMTALDLPNLQELMLQTYWGTCFERPQEHCDMTPYCGLTRLTQLTQLVNTLGRDSSPPQGISMLEALPLLKDLSLTQVPFGEPFGHLTSVTSLYISFNDVYSRDCMGTWDTVSMIGHLTALRSLTFDCDFSRDSPALFPAGSFPALTELCFEGMDLSVSGRQWDGISWVSLAHVAPLLFSRFVNRCAPGMQDSLRKVRFSPVPFASQEPEQALITVGAGGVVWLVMKIRGTRDGAEVWDVECQALEILAAEV